MTGSDPSSEVSRRQYLGAAAALAALPPTTKHAIDGDAPRDGFGNDDRQAVLDVLEQADGIGLGPREVAANTDLDEARAAEVLAQLEAEDRVMNHYHLIP